MEITFSFTAQNIRPQLRPNQRISNEKLIELQKDPNNLRHICILAHVDHGKTTIADLLLATNGIINKKMAGQLRFLDDRLDEQRRGITMKSSAVALYYEHKNEFLINLIDSPGHIDFHTEVLSAARISDGAIIVIDVIEGVCAQTLSSIEIAYKEKLKMILVLNKIDRLITEKRMNSNEILLHLSQVLENVNAVVAEIRLRVYTLRDEEEIHTEQEDDEFCPEKRNVIFGSAVDGWGFRLYEFAQMYSEQLNKSVEWLEKNLWGDVYYNNKKNEFLNGARQKNKKPLFVSLILENILSLYENIVTHRNPDKITKILEKLKIKINRETNSNNPKNQLRAVATEWLPISKAIMNSVTDLVPSPFSITQEKTQHILRIDDLNDEQKSCVINFEPYIQSCASQSPIIAYSSKFITVDKTKLTRKSNVVTQVDIEERRKIIAQIRKDMQNKLNVSEKDITQDEKNSQEENITEQKEDIGTLDERNGQIIQKNTENNIEFIACIRIFSGTLKIGSELYILSPNTNFGIVDQKNDTTKKIVVTEMYLLLGRDLIPITEACAGNIVGLGNISKNLLKSGTLSSTLDCIPIIENDIALEPFYRTAITPIRTLDLPNLKEAIKLLLQCDSCVQCVEQEDGQLVLLTAGDVHLDKCKEDLKKFTDIEFKVSKPMVRLRETILNENENFSKSKNFKIAEVGLDFSLYATQMPPELQKIITDHFYLLKLLENSHRDIKNKNLIEKIKTQLNNCLEKIHPKFKNGANHLISVGNNQFDTCVLLNLESEQNIFVNTSTNDITNFYERILIAGFQLAISAGPLCGEPIKNCVFCVTKFTMDIELAKISHTNISGNFISEIKEVCYEALKNQNIRLMEPFYQTNLNVEASIMGKLSRSLYKRNGRIISTEQFAPGIFTVHAILPVVDSFNFSNEIRTDTGGKANPFLEFSHYEIIDQNPFDILLNEEETEIENRANKLMNDVRRRKGLHVDEKIVMFAEKQRTLNKKK